jgi:adenylosuccinate synthase
VAIQADIVVDLQYGDSGKGKVTHFLAKSKKYTHVLRYNGGCNAGHTIFHKGKKFVTHHIPAGVFWGVKSVIGPGCVLDPQKFLEEIDGLEKGGIDTKGLVLIAKNTHIITDAHKHDDSKDARIGTTKQGNGPAYRDKYARIGMRAESVPELKAYIVDLYDEFHVRHKKVNILGEGAQGFGLDIDWGDYPYVTSSHATAAGFLLNGVPPQSVRSVYGNAKIYETYVGAKKFEPDDPVFAKIREIGEEYGATTGRARQCNWIDMDLLERGIRMNGVTHLVLNKVDVLRAVGAWGAIAGGKTYRFKTEKELKDFIGKRLAKIGVAKSKIFFSESKEKI